jgi:chromosome segregation ATPase
MWASRRQCAAPSPFVPASGTSGFEQLEQAQLQLARAEEEKRALRAWAALAEERVAHLSGMNAHAETAVAGAQATLAAALDEQRTALEAQQELHQAQAELGEAEERYDFLRQAKKALREELQRAQGQVAELQAERLVLLARGEQLAEERRREASGLEQHAASTELRRLQLVREVDVLTAAREAVRSALLRSDAALRHAEERLSRGEAQWRSAAQRGDALEGELRRERNERSGATARAEAAEARLAAARREADAWCAEAARHAREEAKALAEIEQLRTHAGVVRAEADASMARAAFAEERWSSVLREREEAREEARRTAERLGALEATLAASEARAVAAEERVVDEELRARADAASLERAIVNAAYFKRPACVEGAHCLTCGVCHVGRNSEMAPLELVTRRSPSWALAGCVAPLERGALSHPCGTAHAQRGSDAEADGGIL